MVPRLATDVGRQPRDLKKETVIAWLKRTKLQLELARLIGWQLTTADNNCTKTDHKFWVDDLLMEKQQQQKDLSDL